MSKRMPMAMVIVLLAASLAAPAARAGLDPDPDSMGVYFDVAGVSNCRSAPPFNPVSAYLLLMNPTEAIEGFAVSLNLLGAPHFILSQDVGVGRTDDDGSLSGIRAIGGYPVPAGGALILCTWTLIVQAPAPLEFYLGPHPDPSLPRDLPVLLRDGQWIRCGISSGNPQLLVAAINPDMWPLGDETTSFGAVKGLFR